MHTRRNVKGLPNSYSVPVTARTKGDSRDRIVNSIRLLPSATNSYANDRMHSKLDGNEVASRYVK